MVLFSVCHRWFKALLSTSVEILASSDRLVIGRCEGHSHGGHMTINGSAKTGQDS